MMKNKIAFLILFLFVTVIQGCAKTNFKKVNEESTSVTAEPAADVQVPPTEGDIPAKGATKPQLFFQINNCQANTVCVVDFYLTEPFKGSFEFSWATNDTKYQTDPLKYAQPGKHYVAGSGILVFKAGETHQQIHIQALEGFSEIAIPFIWDHCRFDAQAVDCRSILKTK